MEKLEKQTMAIPYFATFDDLGTFGYNIGCKKLILDTICLYGLVDDNSIQTEVQFDIKRIGDKSILYPKEIYSKYLLKAEQVVTATILKMNCDEYFSVSEKDGDYMFVLKE